jgi:hypothetical protein
MPCLSVVAIGVFMANPSKLLSAYERMVAAEEEKHRLMPERLVTLIADKPWIKAVSRHSEARQAFVEAAIDFCRSEKAKVPKTSRKTYPKRAIRSSGRDIHVS